MLLSVVQQSDSVMYMYIYTHNIGEGNGNPLQYSCLENPMDRGAWWAIVHGVKKSQTLSDEACIYIIYRIFSDSFPI